MMLLTGLKMEKLYGHPLTSDRQCQARAPPGPDADETSSLHL